MTIILDGKKLAAEITVELKQKIEVLKGKGVTPKLVVIQVGENPASKVYIKMKQKKAVEIGAICELKIFPDDVVEFDIAKQINDLNHDKSIHGIILQLPLPDHLNANFLINKISPKKDVDGLTDHNQSKILKNETDGLIPATPRGIISLLNKYDFEFAGKKAVVVGRSQLVGKTIAMLLLNQNATVTICHSKTTDLTMETKSADLLIVAAGVPGLITARNIKPGAWVVDVGTNRTEQGLTGDVDFQSIEKMAGFVSPVPGGVGPMTVVSLFANLVDAMKNEMNIC